MRISTNNAGKNTKVKCEKCGENYYNKNFNFQCSTYNSGWKELRSYIYTRNIYLCYNCFIDVFNDIANDVLGIIQKFPINGLNNISHIEKLAKIKHEERQIKLKERNSGIDVVGII